MSINYNNKFSLNNFLKVVQLKKSYLKQLKSKILVLNKTKNYKNPIILKSVKNKNYSLIMYIVSIKFSKSNTLLQVSDCSGNLKFFYSAGSFNFSENSKVTRTSILRKFYRVLISKLKFLRKNPIAIHFTNVKFNTFWFLKKLKSYLFIITIKYYSLYPYNGCRMKKVRRKKNKKILKINKRRSGRVV